MPRRRQCKFAHYWYYVQHIKENGVITGEVLYACENCEKELIL